MKSHCDEINLQKIFLAAYYSLLWLSSVKKLMLQGFWCLKWNDKGFHSLSGFVKGSMHPDSSNFNTVCSYVGFCQISNISAEIFRARYLPQDILKILWAAIIYRFLYRKSVLFFVILNYSSDLSSRKFKYIADFEISIWKMRLRGSSCTFSVEPLLHRRVNHLF